MKKLQLTPDKAEKPSITEKKADKRMRIMRAAIDLFREKGYEATRIIDIARKAGIGKGTVYAYFDGKEGLVLEIVRDIVFEDYREFFSQCDGARGTKERLMALLSGAERMIDSYGLYAKVFFVQFAGNTTVDAGPVMELVKSMTDDQVRRVRWIISEAFEENLNKSGDSGKTEEEIDNLVNLVMMVVTSYMMSLIGAEEADRCGIPADIPAAEKEKIADFIIRGIGLGNIIN